MRIEKRAGDCIILGLVALWLCLLSLVAFAGDNSGYESEYCEHHDCSVPGADGADGIDGVNGIDGVDGQDGANGLNGTNGYNGANYDDTDVLRGLTIAGAFANIPALSHVGVHNHTGMGVGVANFSNETAIAIGLLHQVDNMSFKLTAGIAGNQQMVGGGASFAF